MTNAKRTMINDRTRICENRREPRGIGRGNDRITRARQDEHRSVLQLRLRRMCKRGHGP
jgi:hypothetical protein